MEASQPRNGPKAEQGITPRSGWSVTIARIANGEIPPSLPMRDVVLIPRVSVSVSVRPAATGLPSVVAVAMLIFILMLSIRTLGLFPWLLLVYFFSLM